MQRELLFWRERVPHLQYSLAHQVHLLLDDISTDVVCRPVGAQQRAMPLIRSEHVDVRLLKTDEDHYVDRVVEVHDAQIRLDIVQRIPHRLVHGRQDLVASRAQLRI